MGKHPSARGRGLQAARRREAHGRLAGFLIRLGIGWVAAIFTLSAFPQIKAWAIHATYGSLGLFMPSLAIGPGHSLIVAGEQWAIVPDCTSLMPTITLSLAILAYPASSAWKAAGVAAGAAALWVFNLFRIILLALARSVAPAAFSLLHVYLFQTLSLIIVCGLFVFWISLQPSPVRNDRAIAC